MPLIVTGRAPTRDLTKPLEQDWDYLSPYWQLHTHRGPRSLTDMLAELPETFHSLRFLYLSIYGNLGVPMLPKPRKERLEEVLGHFDRVVGHMQEHGHLRDCRISIPTTWYSREREWGRNEWICCPPLQPVWRDIPKQEVGGQLSGTTDASVLNQCRGYWLVADIKQ